MYCLNGQHDVKLLTTLSNLSWQVVFTAYNESIFIFLATDPSKYGLGTVLFYLNSRSTDFHQRSPTFISIKKLDAIRVHFVLRPAVLRLFRRSKHKLSVKLKELFLPPNETTHRKRKKL